VLPIGICQGFPSPNSPRMLTSRKNGKRQLVTSECLSCYLQETAEEGRGQQRADNTRHINQQPLPDRGTRGARVSRGLLPSCYPGPT
jgi:hypothetical protein